MIQRTRLVKPKIHAGYVGRKRLFKTLEENWQKPFHQIVAPAGYGKSTLMSLWLDRQNNSFSWFTIDDDCNDMRVFLSYLGEFLQLEKKSSRSDLLEVVEALELPALNFIKQIVLQDISHSEPGHVFVFDDYHLIHNEDIHSLMNAIVKNFSSEFKLVILSRSDSKLNFHKPEMYGQLQRIDLQDLKFFPEEIQLLSLEVYSKSMDAETAQFIYDVTEGWIVPVRLILKAFSRGVAPKEIIDGTRIQFKGMTEYLLEEVLNFENDEIKDLMMAVSLFDRFNLEMISVIIEADDLKTPEEKTLVKAQMKEFISRSLFIIAKDNMGIWYRFHDLISSFLRNRLSHIHSTKWRNDAIKPVSNYLETQGLLEEALRLNLKYGLITPAIDILVRHRERYLNLNRFDILEQWLDFFPPEIVGQEPELLLIKIYLAELSSDFNSIKLYSEQLKKLISQLNLSSELTDKYWAEYHCMSSVVDVYTGKLEKGLEKMTLAMNLASSDQTYVLGFSLIFKSLVLAASGREKEARIMIENDRNELSLEDSMLISQNLVARAFVEYMSGNIGALKYEASSILRLANPYNFYAVFTMANYYAAISDYFQNRLETIQKYIAPPLEHKFRSRPGWVLHIMFLKGLHLTAEYREDELLKCIEEMEEYNHALTHQDFSNEIRIMKCEFYMMQGNITKAWNISLKADFEKRGVTHRYFCPRLTRIKLLIFKGDSKHLESAKQLILEFERDSGEPQSRIFSLQLQSLKIMLLIKQEDIYAALDLLKDLLKETQKETIIRLYTDLGEEMRTLLNELNHRGEIEAHFLQVLASFDERDHFMELKKQKVRLQEIFEIFNSLSSVELKILESISKGMRNKEIADDMHYSLGTVKTYLYNIYKKIEVKNRTNAILLYNDFRNSQVSIT